jgi:hypothetical protein
MVNIYIGIDNGSTGTCGLITSDGYVQFFKTPTKDVQNYTKEAKIISRINCTALKGLLTQYGVNGDETNTRCLIERPFMAPVSTIIDSEGKSIPTVQLMLLKASLNAHRAFEATLITLESMHIGYEVVDSKAWQGEMLGRGIKGTPALKAASRAKGLQMFPQFEKLINSHKDADGLMIAAFAQKFYNQ